MSHLQIFSLNFLACTECYSNFFCNLSDSQTSVSMNDFSHTCHSLFGVGGGNPAWAGVVFKGSASTFERGIPLTIFDRLRQDSLKVACSISYVSEPVFPRQKQKSMHTRCCTFSSIVKCDAHCCRRSPKGLHRANVGRYRLPVLHTHLYRVATCPTLLPFCYVL